MIISITVLVKIMRNEAVRCSNDEKEFLQQDDFQPSINQSRKLWVILTTSEPLIFLFKEKLSAHVISLLFPLHVAEIAKSMIIETNSD